MEIYIKIFVKCILSVFVSNLSQKWKYFWHITSLVDM